MSLLSRFVGSSSCDFCPSFWLLDLRCNFVVTYWLMRKRREKKDMKLHLSQGFGGFFLFLLSPFFWFLGMCNFAYGLYDC